MTGKCLFGSDRTSHCHHGMCLNRECSRVHRTISLDFLCVSVCVYFSSEKPEHRTLYKQTVVGKSESYCIKLVSVKTHVPMTQISQQHEEVFTKLALTILQYLLVQDMKSSRVMHARVNPYNFGSATSSVLSEHDVYSLSILHHVTRASHFITLG